VNYVCTKCLVEKPATEYYAYKNNKIKGVMARCKECVKRISAESRVGRKVTEKDRARRKRWEAKNKEKIAARCRERRAKNPMPYRASILKWERNNPHKKARYRKGKKIATPRFADFEKMKVVIQKAALYGLEVDHIVPLVSDTVCGLHCWHNLQLLDKKLNASKGNKYWPDMPETPQFTAAQLQAITS
jgi:hypothetical protein